MPNLLLDQFLKRKDLAMVMGCEQVIWWGVGKRGVRLWKIDRDSRHT
ncbi:hypothetical protein ACKFRM_05465 [Corynebacterium sp. YSMAA1_1_D6]|nr:hypothetical protein [uncultured Corynebacterium sp.]